MRPLQCYTLAVDPGVHCGVAIYGRGKYIDSSHGDGYSVEWIRRWIDAARYFARVEGLPLVLVLEKPPRGGGAFFGRSPEGPASVIGSRRLWLHEWAELGMPAGMHCDVYPVTWRARILGMTSGPVLERAELVRASGIMCRPLQSRDEAAATLIGEWSCRSGAIAALLSSAKRASDAA